ncbi:MAG: hypothetical protein Q9168_001286 [Polycauliona sp. 1 TL-2023]
MSRLSFLAVYLFLHIVHAQLKTCFYFGGESSVDFPCDPEAETSACCGGDWICGTNLYCESKDGDRYQGSCTDSNWDMNNNPACPFALYNGEPADFFDYGQNTTRCTNTNPQTLCPNNNFAKSNNTCCNDHEGIEEINYLNNKPLPTAKADLSSYYADAGLTIPTDGVYKAVGATSTSGSPSSAATGAITAAPAQKSATPPPSDQSDTSSGLSTGAKAGIGIGVALGVLALAGAAIFFFFFMRKRKSRKNNDAAEREQPPMSNYPQYSNVPQELGPGADQSVTGYYKTSELPDEPARMELDSSQEYGAAGGNRRVSEMPG